VCTSSYEIKQFTEEYSKARDSECIAEVPQELWVIISISQVNIDSYTSVT
jgi:hypothetical protein